ncbi:cardioactive peptide-like [Camponotus floridanus]|uniref:cardioactive peptide-like n=1 Tax=Camponotus floridanus TaxID=104421 RepID=UPI00059B6FDA|nr:cardioactive peptide-like [Camponotus floridanus]
MKITEYLCCMLACMSLLQMVNTEVSKEKFERQLLDALMMENTMKPKRPFCNAFTGCGRYVSEEKREEKKEPRISTLLHLLRTLLNTSKQNTWNTIDRENYQLQQMPQVYVSNRMPLRDRQES